MTSVLILLRNKLAFPVFAVSLAAFLVSLIYTLRPDRRRSNHGRPDGDCERRHRGPVDRVHVVFMADDEAGGAALSGGSTICLTPAGAGRSGAARERTAPSHMGT
jgi:hypothetical protein